MTKLWGMGGLVWAWVAKFWDMGHCLGDGWLGSGIWVTKLGGRVAKFRPCVAKFGKAGIVQGMSG